MEDKKESKRFSFQLPPKTTTYNLLLSRSCCKLVVTGATSGAGTAYRSGTPDFIPGL